MKTVFSKEQKEAIAYFKNLQLDHSKSYIEVYEETANRLKDFLYKERRRGFSDVVWQWGTKGLWEDKLFDLWKERYQDCIEQAKGCVKENAAPISLVYYACYRRFSILLMILDKKDNMVVEALHELRLVRRGALEYFYYIEKWSNIFNVHEDEYKRDLSVLDCYAYLDKENIKDIYAEALGKLYEIITDDLAEDFTKEFLDKLHDDFFDLATIWSNEKQAV